MGIFARKPPADPLAPPIPFGEGLILPNVKVLRKAELAAQAEKLFADASGRTTLPSMRERGREFAEDLVPSLAPFLAGEGGLVASAGLMAALGFAIAELEAERGWQRAGLIDGRVRLIFDWYLPRELQKRQEGDINEEDLNAYQLQCFMPHAAYYQARTGPAGTDVLKNIRFRRLSGRWQQPT